MEDIQFLELQPILEESWHSILKGYPGDKWTYKSAEGVKEGECFLLNMR